MKLVHENHYLHFILHRFIFLLSLMTNFECRGADWNNFSEVWK